MWCSTFRQLPVLQYVHYLRRDRKMSIPDTAFFPWDLATKILKKIVAIFLHNMLKKVSIFKMK